MDEEENSVSSLYGTDANEQNAVEPATSTGAPISEGEVAPPVTTQPTATPATPTGSGVTGSNATGSAVGSSNPSGMFPVNMQDFLYQGGIQPLPASMYENMQKKVGLETLGLSEAGGQVVNDNVSGESSILINSDRVIINSKTSHTIIAGAEGVSISSVNKVNIDADESVTIFGTNGVFLGVPNKGVQPPPYPDPEVATAGEGAFKRGNKKLKSYPTPDVPYEPMVLGLKLVNWLDDLLVVLKNLQILTNTGLATPREDGQWDFFALQARLPELISNYIFLDGYSHDKMDYKSVKENIAPTADQVTKPKTSINVNLNLTAAGLPSAGLTPTAPSGPNISKPGYGESGGVLPSLNLQ